MKKIFILSPHSSDANSFWRCMGPLSYLAKNSNEYEITVAPVSVFFWDTLGQYDLVFLHRPCRPDDLKLLQLAKTLNIPVWSDYDDWLFHLPDWNPSAAAYHNSNTQMVMASCIACSDVVTVSTSLLQKEFSKVNSNVIIVPNAYRDDLFPFRTEKPHPRKEIYYWRGTNTHDGDLLSVTDGFRSLTKKTIFMGSPAYALTSTLNKELVEIQNHVDVLHYWKMIYQKAPKILLFPLDGHYFNQCKSNIAWIEAIHAGALVVAPDLPEWKLPGVVSYVCNNSESFLEAAETAMALDQIQIEQINADAFSYMKANFGISIVNAIRVGILNSMLSRDFKRNERDPFDQMVGLWGMSVLRGETPKID